MRRIERKVQSGTPAGRPSTGAAIKISLGICTPSGRRSTSIATVLGRKPRIYRSCRTASTSPS